MLRPPVASLTDQRGQRYIGDSMEWEHGSNHMKNNDTTNYSYRGVWQTTTSSVLEG